MNRVYLILGGNMGKRDEVMFHALRKIDRQVGKIIQQSSIYETAPWGFKDQALFYNCVVLLETQNSAMEVLEKILSIEQQIGRIRGEQKWQERLIDIDILFFNDDIIEAQTLQVPHPLMHKRRFTLIPLSEISPDYIHPGLKMKVRDLLISCEDKLEAKKVIESKLFMDIISS